MPEYFFSRSWFGAFAVQPLFLRVAKYSPENLMHFFIMSFKQNDHPLLTKYA